MELLQNAGGVTHLTDYLLVRLHGRLTIKQQFADTMAYNEKLADRVREALADLPHVEEKKMFGGLAFMVNGKMCINVSKDRLMCRIDPAIHHEAVEQEGIETVQMRGSDYIGYIYINEAVIKSNKNFNYWVEHALDFNKIAKASKKK